MRSLLVGAFLWFALVISLMPIIAWYAGLAGLAYFVFQAIQARKTGNAKVLKPAEHKVARLRGLLNFPYGRLTLYIIFFGLVLHVSCKIHSRLLVNALYNEAVHEKNIILSDVKKP